VAKNDYITFFDEGFYHYAFGQAVLSKYTLPLDVSLACPVIELQAGKDIMFSFEDSSRT